MCIIKIYKINIFKNNFIRLKCRGKIKMFKNILNIPADPIVRQYAVVITANFSVILLGLSLVWPSPVLVNLRNQNQTVLPHPITEEEGAWIVSISPLAAIIVFAIPGYLIDRIGRKKIIILSCVPRLLISVLFIFASEVWMLLLGRALFGALDFFIISVSTTYASEIASKEVRGALGTITQLLSSLGTLFMLSMGPYVSYITLNIIATCLIVVLTLPLFFLPETPYFLYSKGRTEDLMKVLTFLRGSEELAHEEIKEYSMHSNAIVNKRQLLKDRIFLKTMAMVTFMSIEMQLMGYNAISFYLQTIFESTHTSVSSELSSMIIGFIQLFACLCTILLTDHFGRKPIITITLLGMTIGMIGLGIFFKLMDCGVELVGFINYLPLISVMLVIFCWNAGMGSLFWLMVTELFNGPSRALGVATGVFVTAIFVFLTTKFFGTATEIIGPALTYWIFSANCIITLLFITFFVPETKGKTFAEIQEALGRRDEKNNIQSKLYGLGLTGDAS